MVNDVDSSPTISNDTMDYTPNILINEAECMQASCTADGGASHMLCNQSSGLFEGTTLFKVLNSKTPSSGNKNDWFLLQAKGNGTDNNRIPKNNKLSKVVLYCLDGAITGEAKATLIMLNFKCSGVK
uniref:Uncharacterized protein n=1 Tax=Glossina pallidipes TaxID=7398 RepID=A0A1B0A6R4_GLOPL